jgi:hypothetical protein
MEQAYAGQVANRAPDGIAFSEIVRVIDELPGQLRDRQLNGMFSQQDREDGNLNPGVVRETRRGIA